MSTTIDVLDILTKQHSDVDQLIEQLETGSGDREERFRALADTVAAHATVEEKLLYPVAMNDDTAELVAASIEAHLAIKRVLADMLALDFRDPADAEPFNAKLAVLKAVARYAHEEEEGKLFPKLRQLLPDDERAALGSEVQELFERLMPDEPRYHVPDTAPELAPMSAV